MQRTSGLSGNVSLTRRKNIIVFVIVLVAVIFIFRLFFIQVMDHSYKLSASNNVLRYITEYPARGLIYDRKGELLVFNEAHYDLMVIPGQVKAMDTLEFCQILGIDIASFEQRLQHARRFSRFKSSVFERQISKDTYAYLQEKMFRFPGFYVQPRTLRSYAHPVAAHTFGYVGEVGPEITARDPYYKPGDYFGISGIEKSYEEELRGRKGVRIVMVDVHNREIGPFQKGRYDTTSVSGKNLYTSLDAELQRYGELLMRNKRGSIVAIEPSSGEILALVTMPSYDPGLLVGRVRTSNYAQLNSDPSNPLFNRALMARYPPGSAFKVANTLIGLQEGVITPQTRIGCPGAYSAGGVTVRCRGHISPTDVRSSIQFSCNTYSCVVFRALLDRNKFANITEAYNNWREHVMSLGFGKVFNNDLPHELSGLIPTADYYDRYHGKNRWKSLTVISLAIGQGEIGATPMQMANLGAIVANRGYYYTPHIVRAIEYPDSINPRFKEKHFTSIDKEHFEVMADAMFQVMEGGTGRGSRVEGLDICGKTGTVQNPHGADHSVFIAFAPKDNPKIAINVIVENSGFGSTWAAPIASLMIEKYLTGQVSRPWVESRIVEANLLNVAPKK